MRRILILGGTTEARRLAERLVERVELNVTVSLAGRTTAPAAQAAPVRIGGFGGAEGLAHYLTNERVDVLIHATHPYPAIISAHAGGAATYGKIAAARVLGLPVILLRRPILPEVPTVGTVEEAMTWLDHAVALRGV